MTVRLLVQWNVVSATILECASVAFVFALKNASRLFSKKSFILYMLVK